MTMHEPFIDDPAHLKKLAGWHFAVLRVPPPMSHDFLRIQEGFRERLKGQTVSYPARAHITLAGFRPGSSSSTLQGILKQWAATMTPLRVEAYNVGTFPAPFQIVFIEVRKTAALDSALSGLRAAAGDPILLLNTAIPIHEWRFHISVAYCERLSQGSWLDVEQATASHPTPLAIAEIDAIELVSFSAGQESPAGRYALGA